MRRSILVFALVQIAMLASCEGATPQASTTEASRSADARIDAALAPHGSLRAIVRRQETSRAPNAASVRLPERASEHASVHDTTTGIGIRFALDEAQGVALESHENVALANAAFRGKNHVVYRAHDSGLEDYVLFDEPPAETRVRYSVEASGAGLRLVSRSLEVLDEHGAPRVRMAPPYLLGADGTRTDVDVEVHGCAVDRDPRPPWGRAVTPPGASSCVVELRWDGREVVYPAALDPAWTTTSDPAFEHDVDYMDIQRGVILPSGLALVLGGTDSTGAGELFDEATGTWATTSGPGTGMWDASTTLLTSGKVLVIAEAGTHFAALYDPAAATWTRPALLSTDAALSATLKDGRVLVVGGNASQIFDPSTSTFVAAPDLPSTHWDTCVTSLPDGTAMVAGGWDGKNALKTTAMFDPVAGSWSAGPSMSTERGDPRCTRLPNGQILITGGWDRASVSSAEIYDPTTKTFRPTGGPAAPRDTHGATVAGGSVLVTGGNYGSFQASTERYDPTSGTFLPAGNLVHVRTNHIQLTLKSGNVLVVGGWGGYHPFMSGEVFHMAATGKACQNDGECPSGHCTDGVCCDQTCKAPCYACSAAKKGGGPDGVCGPVVSGPDPYGRCTALPQSSCATNGLCNGAGACAFYPKGSECQPLSCHEGSLSQSSCDGAGLCVPTTTSCNGFACGDGASCKSGACTNDADCITTYECVQGACVLRKPVCDGDHTLVGLDGSRVDCAPYACANNACLTRCGSSTECDDAHVCNHLGVCIRREDAEQATNDGFLGCQTSGSRRGTPFAAFVWLAAAVGLCRARRRT